MGALIFASYSLISKTMDEVVFADHILSTWAMDELVFVNCAHWPRVTAYDERPQRGG
jgi:hypothetical protein